MVVVSGEYEPISALNDLLFCERRCGMHRIETVWTDNVYTLEGTHAHKRAHRTVEHQGAPGARVVHGLLLKSDRLRLIGKADVVEFRWVEGRGLRVEGGKEVEGREFKVEGAPSEVGNQKSVPQDANSPLTRHYLQTDANSGSQRSTLDSQLLVPYPIEYKRGRRRRWDNDDVQLCAQALCLEEMLSVAVPAGAIFHVKSKRRREIMFTRELRAKTEHAARRLHELVASGITPPPVLKPRCRGCSLHDLCMPELLGQTRRIRDYHTGLFVVQA
jgi:CRISPR-associated exonuclease Cas4